MDIWQPEGIEELCFSGEYIHINSRDGTEYKLHYKDALTSFTLPSRIFLSKPTRGDLAYVSATGQKRRFYYDERHCKWRERKQAPVSSTKKVRGKEWSVTDRAPPPGYEWEVHRIDFDAGWPRTQGNTVDYVRTLTLGDDGSFSEQKIGRIEFDTDLEGVVDTGTFLISKVFVANYKYRLVVQDLKTKHVYRYECVESGDGNKWYELFLSPETLYLPSTTTLVGYICIWRVIASLCACALAYYLYLQIPPYKYNRFETNLPAVVIFYIFAWSIVAFVVCLACSFLFDCKRFRRKQDKCIAVGGFVFFLNGNIRRNDLQLRFNCGRKCIDGYELLSLSDTDASVTRGASEISVSRWNKKFSVQHRIVKELSKHLVHYDPISPYSSLRPDYSAERESFRGIATHCGVMHDGYEPAANQAAFDKSFEVGGVTFHFTGQISFADKLLLENESLPQIRYGEVLVAKKRAANGLWWVRVLHVDGDYAWFYRYEHRSEHSVWNLMRWDSRRVA